jgi:pimeloyl-ACP methyl ester carboxylesterase
VSRKLLAVIGLLGIVLSACTRTSTATNSASPSALLPAPGAIKWTSCGSGFQCGSLTVPLDYANPDKDIIKLALIRKPATDPAHRIGSLLTNPGGPGASGIDYLRQAAGDMANLNKRFDLVGFDPRGIGQSAPVRCLSTAQEDAFNALDPVLDDSQEKAAAIQADKDFAAGCETMSARILPFIGTPNVARDMDEIRAAVGDAKLTYLGFSYGTYVGQWYAHLFPTHVRALSLDGVVDPALTANGLLLDQVVSFQKNLEAYAAGCSGRNACQYARGGDPVAAIVSFLQRLDDQPLQVGNRQLTRALALYGIATPLYDPGSWQYLDQGLTTALNQGNGRLLLAFSDLYLGRNADGSYTNESDASYAVNCLDHPVPADVAAFDALQSSFANASAAFGAAFQYSNLPCTYWPVKPQTQPGPLTADGAPPILLVGGTNDPATPYAWAQGVNRELSNSVLLTRQGDGHVSYDKSKCAKDAEDAYLINLTVPAAGATCTDSA